jgi:TolA-binding protein
VSDRYKGHILSVEALMGLGRSLMRLDRGNEAMEVYRRIIEEYPGTRWSVHAETQVASLGR